MCTIPPIATQTPATPTPEPMPLSQPGPYFVGRRAYTRESQGKKVEITIWYPAIKPEGYAADFSAEFVGQYGDLAWGVYSKK